MSKVSPFGNEAFEDFGERGCRACLWRLQIGGRVFLSTGKGTWKNAPTFYSLRIWMTFLWNCGGDPKNWKRNPNISKSWEFKTWPTLNSQQERPTVPSCPRKLESCASVGCVEKVSQCWKLLLTTLGLIECSWQLGVGWNCDSWILLAQVLRGANSFRHQSVHQLVPILVPRSRPRFYGHDQHRYEGATFKRLVHHRRCNWQPEAFADHRVYRRQDRFGTIRTTSRRSSKDN